MGGDAQSQGQGQSHRQATRARAAFSAAVVQDTSLPGQTLAQRESLGQQVLNGQVEPAGADQAAKGKQKAMPTRETTSKKA